VPRATVMTTVKSTATHLRPTVLLLALLAGCGPGRGDDRGLLYEAVLRTPDLLRYNHGRGLALERHLMSDSGTYEASGLVPDAVVAFLQYRGTIGEVCAPLDTQNEVPSCQAASARGELRVSRPVPVGDSEFVIFVGQATLPARNDTSKLHLFFATTHRCRIARDGAAWHVRGCDLHMIT